MQVQLTVLSKNPSQTINPTDVVLDEFFFWNVGTEPLQVSLLNYPVRKGETFFFTSPGGGGVLNLILDSPAEDVS